MAPQTHTVDLKCMFSCIQPKVFVFYIPHLCSISLHSLSTFADNQNAVNFWPSITECPMTISPENRGKINTSLHSCSFQKRQATTVVKVSWYGNVAVEQCSSCCMRWYITVNGQECANPGVIDGAVQRSLGTRTTPFALRRPSAISGICYGPTGDANSRFGVGTNTVNLVVGPCPGSNDTFPVSTGYNSNSRFIIEEIAPPASHCQDSVV